MGKIKYRWMCVDIETSGLDWTRDVIHGIGVSYEEGDAEYYLVSELPDNVRADLENPKIAKIGHNFHNFDAKFIKKAGIDIKGEFDDPMILGNLINDGTPLDLKYLAETYLGPESLENKHRLDAYIAKVGAGNIGGLCAQDLANPEHPHKEIIAEYCKEDVINTTKLFFLFVEKLKEMDKILKGPKFDFKKSPLDYYIEEARPLEKVLFDIEYRGVRVNTDYLETIKKHELAAMVTIEGRLNAVMVKRIAKVEDDLYAKAISKEVTLAAKAKVLKGQNTKQAKCKFSWGNNNHIGALLYEHCDLDKKLIKRTAKGKYKTDKTALEMLQIKLPSSSKLQEVLRLIARHKKHQKIASTYTGDAKKGILSKIRYVDGVARIFPNYRQTTGTGRLASSGPNMQNIKRDSEVKKFFIPDNPDEVFDDADYSQIELRTGAHLSQDSGLCGAYRRNEDVHLQTASVLFGKKITKQDDVERQAGKRTNFLTIFDGGPNRLVTCLKEDTGRDFTKKQCKEFIAKWFVAYPDVRGYLDDQLAFFKKYKFCITETGRIRRLPDIIFGEGLSWVPAAAGFGHTPRYHGSQRNRKFLVDKILAKDKKLHRAQVTEEMIGWAAYRRYSHATKAGYNEPIQGLAASMTKRAMIKLHKEGRIIANQVHDNLTVPRKRGDLAAKKHLIDTMESVYPLSIPVVADCKTLESFHPSDKANEQKAA